MIAVREGISGGGTQWSLQHQCFWSTNAERTGEFDIASPFTAIIRMDLVMTYPKIARPCRARKWHAEHSQRKNSKHNLNDSPCIVCECLSYAVPSILTAEPRAIPHAQSQT